MQEARDSHRAVTLNALRGSPALTLYHRLGFAVTREDEVYVDLECRPRAVS